jgi:hypothetical protein
MFRADEVEQLLLRLLLRRDAVLDVRPVEARDEMPRLGLSCRRSAISAWVCRVAVAVRAMRGTAGQRSCSIERRR